MKGYEMASSLLTLETMMAMLVIGTLVMIYFYIENVKEQKAFWERIVRVKGKTSLMEARLLSLRTQTWLSKFYLSNLKNLLRQTSADTAKRYRLRFQQAGWNPQDAPLIVSIVNIGLIFLGFFFYLSLMIHIKSIAALPFLLKIAIFSMIIFTALRGFEYFMDFMIHKRYDRIQGGFSYAIDLMIICTRSGFGLERSLEKIAEEISKYNPDLCKEFTQTAIELTIIPERNIALRNLAQRVNIPVVQILVSGLIQAEEQGAPLSNTLRMMSIEFSKQKMLDIEAKASKLPALLTLPLVLFLLPAMMVVLLGPAVANLIKGHYFG